MGTIIEKSSSGLDKIFYLILGAIMLAFLISIPFMVRDNNRIAAQQWQVQGCEMYDSDTTTLVPPKCENTFVDHYAPQPTRPQPPQVIK